MRRWGPILAIAWVLVAAAITLLGVARNRAGEPDADVVLTERELSLPGWIEEESNGLALHINWRGPRYPASPDTMWLDRAKLESLGFDCSYPVEAPSALEHYERMLPREVVLVLEYEGEAWRKWIVAWEQQSEGAERKIHESTDAPTRDRRLGEIRGPLERERTSATRLFVVDAGLDLADLRRRYTDRSRYILARGIVAPLIELDADKKIAKPATLRGHVRMLLVDAVHVPHGKTALLDSLVASDRRARQAGASLTVATPGQPGMEERSGPPRYKVRVRWGRRLEPWIVGVEPM
jgi:hypothetical protein